MITGYERMEQEGVWSPRAVCWWAIAEDERRALCGWARTSREARHAVNEAVRQLLAEQPPPDTHYMQADGSIVPLPVEFRAALRIVRSQVIPSGCDAP